MGTSIMLANVLTTMSPSSLFVLSTISFSGSSTLEQINTSG